MSLLRFLKKLVTEPIANESVPQSASKLRWTLLLGEEPLGELVLVDYETPWITADFAPTEAFDRFKPYFEWSKQIDEYLGEDDWEPEISDTLKVVIDEVHTKDGFQILSLDDGKREKTMLHFDASFTWTTFR